MSQRIDKQMVELQLCDTRSKAQQLIKEGVVFLDGERVLRASIKTDSTNIEVRKENIFVGRGAHKVEGALKQFDVNPEGMIVADVGACTGGFTDYVLSLGARKVYAIDVGHDQLAEKLRADARVVNLEGTNIRDLNKLDDPIDLAVVDLSFISLKLVMENIYSLLGEQGKVVALVKPQFEVGKENIGKKGIVKNQEVVKETIVSLYDFFAEKGLYIKDFCLSPIRGKTGNTEYFFFFDKGVSSHELELEKIIKIVKEEV